MALLGRKRLLLLAPLLFLVPPQSNHIPFPPKPQLAPLNPGTVIEARDRWIIDGGETAARDYVTEIVKSGRLSQTIPIIMQRYQNNGVTLDPSRVSDFRWGEVANFLDSALHEDLPPQLADYEILQPKRPLPK